MGMGGRCCRPTRRKGGQDSQSKRKKDEERERLE